MRSAVSHALKGKSRDDLEEHVRIAARRAAGDAWGKKPVVRVKLVEI